ncbi:thiamine-phosphate kinase [Skermania sp. ID1734]|uniref:thiamine-phosphate kinase n=1 Tax=Skermania sp. ID1734 TaxID=2597516 RepID=UPI00117CF098|nr:thiamine-phosphate kinase [Skermania sp. ID1734]TSE01042.1 thiamine-phosphate kinase [Skermania sp. ID1734]
METPERTVAELGEFGVIARITAARTPSSVELIGPGDDAAVLRAPDGRFVVTTDMLVQDRHFRLDWATGTEIGRKAIAQNAADVAAMGAQPSAFVVALGCPAQLPLSFVDDLGAGMSAEAARAGAAIVGGDLVSSDSIVISVTAHGDLQGRAPVLRSGAEPDQVVAVSGRLGWAAAGYALLSAGVADVDNYEALRSAHVSPQPPYTAGIAAAIGGATAMIDTSDGLLSDLGHVADASGVAIDIRIEQIDPVLAGAADRLGVDPLAWVLTGGEDHALAAVFPSPDAVPPGWQRIGTTAAGRGVTVDGQPWTGPTGWRSF